MITKCDIKTCSKDRFMGFINYETRQKYRLCFKHYKEWIESKLEVNMYIRKENFTADKNQTRLERVRLIEERYK